MSIVTLDRSTLRGRKRIAVVGSGVSGASAAWALQARHDVTLFEAEARPGGHTATVDVDYDGTTIAVDTGFIVYNELNYPELTALFAHLGIATHESNMGLLAVARRRPPRMERPDLPLDLRPEAQRLLPLLPLDAARDPALQPPVHPGPRGGAARRRHDRAVSPDAEILGRVPRRLPDPDGRRDLVDAARQDARLPGRDLRLVLREPPPHPQRTADVAHRDRRLPHLSRKAARPARRPAAPERPRRPCPARRARRRRDGTRRGARALRRDRHRRPFRPGARPSRRCLADRGEDPRCRRPTARTA
jgi:hypothetical protein